MLPPNAHNTSHYWVVSTQLLACCLVMLQVCWRPCNVQHPYKQQLGDNTGLKATLSSSHSQSSNSRHPTPPASVLGRTAPTAAPLRTTTQTAVVATVSTATAV